MAKKRSPAAKLPKSELVSEDSRLLIKTNLYRNTELVKIIKSGNPLRAAQNLTGHLRKNKYEATHAEIYDLVTGKLYSVVRLDMDGNLRTLFQYALTNEELEA